VQIAASAILAAKRTQPIAARLTLAKFRDSEIENSGNKKAPQKSGARSHTLSGEECQHNCGAGG
jgi:hypothetical protein